MKIIYTNKLEEIIVDDEDFEYLNQFTWCTSKGRKTKYATTGIWNKLTKYTNVFNMHKMIMGSIGIVDHINGNGLDNRRENLRLCSHRDNLRNRGTQKNNKTGHKGVSFYKRLKNKPYKARIHIGDKEIHLGYFETAIEAAKAYNEAAIKYHGEFAKLNKI